MAIITITEILTIFAITITSIVIYFKYKYQYWSKRNVPTSPPTIPWGHVGSQIFQQKSIGEIIQDHYNAWKPRGKRYSGFYSFTIPSLILLEPDLIKTIMTKEFQSFHDRTSFQDEKVEPLSAHLVNLRGAKWRYLRAKLTPTFTSGKMKMMFPTFVACGEQLDVTLSKSVDKNEPIDIKDILARFTTDVIGSCAFGLDCNSLNDPDSEFRKYGRMIFESSTVNSLRRLLLVTFPKVLLYLRIPILRPNIQKFFMDTTKQIVDYREKNKIERKDFMNLLIKLKNNESIDDAADEKVEQNLEDTASKNKEPGLTFNQIAAQAFVFFLAGFETSSSTMTFCLYELSINIEIQNKVRKEILEVLNKHNGSISYESIMEMHYLDKVVKETLRKYPIAPLVNRQCVKDFTIPDSDLLITKGQNVIIPILGMHRDPVYFPDPMKFDPERFNDKETAKRHPYTYIPFGEGPRSCIGMRFGLLQTKVGLACLLKNYSLTLNKSTPQPLVIDSRSTLMTTTDTILLDMKKL